MEEATVLCWQCTLPALPVSLCSNCGIFNGVPLAPEQQAQQQLQSTTTTATPTGEPVQTVAVEGDCSENGSRREHQPVKHKKKPQRPTSSEVLQEGCRILHMLCGVATRKVRKWLSEMDECTRVASECAHPASASGFAFTLLALATAYKRNNRPNWLFIDAGLVLEEDLPHGSVAVLRSMIASTETHSPAYVVMNAVEVVEKAQACAGKAIAKHMLTLMLEAVCAVLEEIEYTIFTLCTDAVGLAHLHKYPPPKEWAPTVQHIQKHFDAGVKTALSALPIPLLQYIDPTKHSEDHGYVIAAAAIRSQLQCPRVYPRVVQQLHCTNIAALHVVCPKLFTAMELDNLVILLTKAQ